MSYAPTPPLPSPPTFRYTAPWTECSIIHEHTTHGARILVVGDPSNGCYEWIVLDDKGQLAGHSDAGYGISEVALRDGLIHAFQGWFNESPTTPKPTHHPMNWTPEELAAIDQLALLKDLPPSAIIRQALRAYQLAHAPLLAVVNPINEVNPVILSAPETLPTGPGSLLDTLANVTAALDTVLLHQGQHMTPEDLCQRRLLIAATKNTLTQHGIHL